MQKLMNIFLNVIFNDEISNDDMNKKLGIKCCRFQHHSDSCTQKWQNLKNWLKGNFIEDIQNPQPYLQIRYDDVPAVHQRTDLINPMNVEGLQQYQTGPTETQRDGERRNEESQLFIDQSGSPGELRLQTELNQLNLPDNTKIYFPDANNKTHFNIILNVTGRSSLWSGARTEFTFDILPGYPHDPPQVLCITKIYHPNIDLQGNVSLNILRSEWKPVFCIKDIILELDQLFFKPNLDDPINNEAADLMRNHNYRFVENVWRSLRGLPVDGNSFPQLLKLDPQL